MDSLVRFGGSKPIDDDIYDLILRLPKTSLHVHLGGSTPLDIIKQALIPRLGINHPDLEWERLREAYRIMRYDEYQRPINATDLHDDGARDQSKPDGLERYRQAYDRLPKIVTTLNYSYAAAHAYTKNSAADNVRYFELRTNPIPKDGSMPEDFIKAICVGIDDAKTELAQDHRKIDYGIILLAYRHGDSTINPKTGRMKKVDAAIKVADLAIELRRKGYPIVGIDLAGDEANHPVTDFEEFFTVIQKHNETAEQESRIGITIHAGETHGSGELSGPESVREAIRLAWDKNTPVRIGHGVQAARDAALLQDIKDKNIGLEMCPKSNVQTEAVDWYSDHPALALSRAGVPVSISPDNETISATNPTNEFVKLYKYTDRTGARTLHEDRKRMVLSGLQTAFIPDPRRRAEIIADVEREFAKMERDPLMRLAMYKESHQGKEPSPLVRTAITLFCHAHNLVYEAREFVRQAVQYVARFVKDPPAA